MAINLDSKDSSALRKLLAMKANKAGLRRPIRAAGDLVLSQSFREESTGDKSKVTMLSISLSSDSIQIRLDLMVTKFTKYGLVTLGESSKTQENPRAILMNGLSKSVEKVE